MPRQRRETSNVGVRHGEWGEDVAVEFLRVHGYEIVDRNVRPCSRDRRLEIDVVAYDRMYDVMAFVEVKQHAAKSVANRLTVTAFERANNQSSVISVALFNLNLRPHNLQRSPHLSYNSIARGGYDGFYAALTTKCAY